jgi:group II intron reverse transcriptase/maturase
MQTAEHILQAIHKMGENRIPITRVYRCLFSEDIFLAAYDKIARNRGALTKGSEDDTADGMSLSRIRRIIEELREEKFRFRPARRIQIPKKSGGTRPLGIPNFSDKLVQEALRMVLETYYEPRFRGGSHGFRPGRGCHTALASLHNKFKGAAWFIEGDIRGCFDHIDHEILMKVLARDIQDGRLLNLIRMSLDAGYIEDWKYHHTYSGTPQGGVLSPLLANIYLNELDVYIEDVLIPQFTRGKKRGCNPEYQKLAHAIQRARKNGNNDLVNQFVQQQRQIPSQNVNDPDFRRLQYIRYADDFILSIIGSKSEAEEIKARISAFLQEHLNLEMSASKSLITHGRTQFARFLGYAISIYQVDDKITPRTGTKVSTRSVNGCVRLGVPYGLVDKRAAYYMRNGKPIHESGVLAYSDAQIINIYQRRFRGFAEYYKYAVDRSSLTKLKYIMEVALVKTLSRKFRVSVKKIYRKYSETRVINGYPYKVLIVRVPTKNGSQEVYWGGISLKVDKLGLSEIVDDRKAGDFFTSHYTDLIQRLQAQECEICGSTEDCDVHHIRKLADLKQRWKGRKEKPDWVVRMIAIRRKTLVVCSRCHHKIHSKAGLPNV